MGGLWIVSGTTHYKIKEMENGIIRKCKMFIYALLSTISGANNMFDLYLKLTLPNMDSSHGDILQPRNGMNYQMTLE